MSKADWNAKKIEILSRIDIQSEVQKFGVRLVGSPSSTGWVPAHNPYKPDKNPSCGICVSSGSQRGYLTIFNTSKGVVSAVSFWDLVRDFHPSLSGAEFKNIIKHYAKETGVELPSKAKIIATYDYLDTQGKLIFQVCRMKPKDFRQRRPDGNGGWVWNLRGVETTLYRLPDILTANRVVIVEGEKDVDRLEAQGFIATTCPMGAGKWKKQYNKYLQNKDVILIPDKDEAGQNHFKSVAHSLWGTTKTIKIVELPGLPVKGDVSDYLDAHSVEDLRSLINNTEPLKEKPPAPENAKTGKPVPEGPECFFSGGNFNPALLCDEFLQKYDCFNDGDGFYIYNDKSGLWNSLHVNEISKIIKNDYLGIMANRNRIADALKLIEIETYRSPEDLKCDRNLLNCQNGMFDIQTGDLLPHHKKYYSRIQLPINYDPEAKCLRWEQFMKEIFKDAPEKIKTIQQFTGYIFCPDNFLEKLLFLIGSGANGKTTFIETLQKMVNPQNACNIDPSSMNESFSLVDLKDKLLNCDADINVKKKIPTNILKKITSKDRVRARRIYQGFISFYSTCKHIFGANEIPRIDDTTHGINRRLIILKLNQCFEDEQKDLRLDEKLTAELSGIFNWAITGLREVLKNNRIFEGKEAKTDKKDFIGNINYVRLFVDEMCVIGNEKLMIRKTHLYEHYKNFHASSNFKGEPLGRNKFYEHLLQNYSEIDETPNGPRCFLHINIVKEA